MCMNCFACMYASVSYGYLVTAEARKGIRSPGTKDDCDIDDWELLCEYRSSAGAGSALN